MSIAPIAPGLFLAAVCVGLATFHARQANRLTLLAWSMLAVGGIYGAGSALVGSGAAQGLNPAWDRYLMRGVGDYAYHNLLALVLLGGIVAGWWLVGRALSRKTAALVQDESDTTPFEMCAYALLIAAVVCQLLYSYAYGGPISLLKYSKNIRAGYFEVPNPLSFLQPFGGLAMFSAFALAGLLLTGTRNLRVVAGFGLSFLVSFYVLYSWLGRISFLIFVMTFVIAGAFRFLRGPMQKMSFLIASLVAILIAAYGISHALRLHAINGLVGFVAKELSYPFVSFFANSANESISYRWLYDFVSAPLFLLPYRLTLGWLDYIDLVNTSLIANGAVVHGAVPIDLLTLGLLQAPIVGIPLTGLIFGSILRLVDTAAERIPHAGVRSVLGVHLGFRLGVLGVSGAAPGLLVRNCLYLLIGGLLLSFLLRYDWRKLPTLGKRL